MLPVVACSSMSAQVHLSHNRITVRGARALLRSLPLSELGPVNGSKHSKPPPALWLRLEWNVIDLDALNAVR